MAKCRAVHALTVSGILVGMVAVVAVLDGSPRAAVLALVATQVIDGVDGPLARKLDVKRVIPKYDGYILDLVIDYVTCVLVPAMFAWEFEVVPHTMTGKISIAAMLASSALWFSRTDMETADHWFRGFPAVWNMVVPTLWLLDAKHLAVTAAVLALSWLSMTDVEFAHPTKARQWRMLNIGFMTMWLCVMTALVAADTHVSWWSAPLLLAGPCWIGVSTTWRQITNPVAGSRHPDD